MHIAMNSGKDLDEGRRGGPGTGGRWEILLDWSLEAFTSRWECSPGTFSALFRSWLDYAPLSDFMSCGDVLQ